MKNIVLNLLRYMIIIPLTWPLAIMCLVSWAIDPEKTCFDLGDVYDLYEWRDFNGR